MSADGEKKSPGVIQFCATWGLLLGLVGNFVYASFSLWISRAEISWQLLMTQLGLSLGAPAFCLAYVSALSLLSTAITAQAASYDDLPHWAQRAFEQGANGY